MSRGIKNDAKSWWEAAGYLARNTACLISCSAFRNSLFTTQACGKGRDSSDSARPRLLNSLSRKMWEERNWINYAFYAINNRGKKKKTLEACRRTSTTTLTGSPGVISFIASIHHLYAWRTRRKKSTIKKTGKYLSLHLWKGQWERKETAIFDKHRED